MENATWLWCPQKVFLQKCFLDNRNQVHATLSTLDFEQKSGCIFPSQISSRLQIRMNSIPTYDIVAERVPQVPQLLCPTEARRECTQE